MLFQRLLPGVQIDLIHKGIKTYRQTAAFKSGNQLVQIDLIHKGIKTTGKLLPFCVFDLLYK